MVDESQKYAKDIPLVEHIKQLEREVDETKRSEERYNNLCKILRSEVSVLDSQRGQYLHELAQSQETQEELEDSKEILAAENKELKIYISNLRTAEKQSAE